MHQKILILLFCMLGVFQTRAEDVVLDRRNQQMGGATDFEVPRGELEKIPPWNPKDQTRAPLSRDVALQIAQKAAAAQGLELLTNIHPKITLLTPNRWETDLVKRLPENCCLWYYCVDFSPEHTYRVDRILIVTMSGAVAKPSASKN